MSTTEEKLMKTMEAHERVIAEREAYKLAVDSMYAAVRGTGEGPVLFMSELAKHDADVRRKAIAYGEETRQLMRLAINRATGVRDDLQFVESQAIIDAILKEKK